MATRSLISAVSKRLEGKVAIITGGASGIGAMTAKVFAHHGARVLVADIQDDLGQSVCHSICPKAVTFVHCDVTNESQVKAVVDKAMQMYGRLDVMFNNAGTTDEYNPRISDNKKSEFERVLGVDVVGVFLGIKHASRAMIPTKSGSIISTASVSSRVGGVTTHAYTAAKHAVAGLTKSAAAELGQFGIRVNAISPSALATPQAMNFLGLDEAAIENLANSVANLKHVTLKTEDVANAALFLASDEGRYVSGHNLFVDGGFSVVNPSLHLFQYPNQDQK